MMRKQRAAKIQGSMKNFLRYNPQIKKALRVFDITLDQYRKAVEEKYYFYTDTTTSPRELWNFKNRIQSK